MYETPSFIRAYWRAMEESLGSFYSTEGVTPLLERKKAAYDAAGFNFTSPFVPSGAGRSIPQFIEQRANFIQPQLNAVNKNFTVTLPLDGTSSDEQAVILSGSAPVAVAGIAVNGRPLDLEWSSASDWSATFLLQPGENVLLIRALGLGGEEIESVIRTITYTGVGSWPGLVINEWMAVNEDALVDPEVGDFDDWIELSNPGIFSADLAGWFLSDDPEEPFKYRIPSGFRIPAGGYLLVWADDEIFQNDSLKRPDLHVAFKLGAGGESILLSAPDGSLIDRVDFDRQSPDKTMGRLGNEILALASPSPGAMNGRAAIMPSATYVVNGDMLTFTLTTEPGFLYQVEVSSDLQSWKPLGNSILSKSETTTFIDTIQVDRRFYRFFRIP
ncbi:lamin tail domain-containing protein, partial [Akkermansiaceae bacterium]|nr:lamin tail domain-containing protein [Akkermansiaceae bacterium]